MKDPRSAFASLRQLTFAFAGVLSLLLFAPHADAGGEGGSLVSAEVRTPALVGHWRFASLVNGGFPDLSGANPPARLVSAGEPATPVFVSSPFREVGQAIALDGTGGHWIRAPFASLQERPALTIELWVKWEGEAGGPQQLLIGNTGGIILSIKKGGVVSAMLAGWKDGKAGWGYSELPERVAPGEWRHLMLRYAGGRFQLALEGKGWTEGRVVMSPVARIPGEPRYKWAETVLGVNPAGLPAKRNAPFNGQIAAVKLHDAVLDDAAFLNSHP